MEVISHSLIGHSLLGSKIDYAIFTNLTEDRLEYHGSFYNYAEAKGKLFDSNILPSVGCYIINADDNFGKGLIKK